VAPGQWAERRNIGCQTLADSLDMAPSMLALLRTAAVQKVGVKRVIARRLRLGRHEVAACVLDQPFDFALVIPFALAAKPVRNQVVADQLAEGACPLTLAVLQDLGHRNLGIIRLLCPDQLCGPVPSSWHCLVAAGHIFI
jgi:hypothetical protein